MVAVGDTLVNQVDPDLVKMWIDLLHIESEGLIHVCSDLDWTGETFDEKRRPLIPAYAQWLHDHGAKGVYMRATTLNRPLAPTERGGEEDSAMLPGVWADVDIAGPGHKTSKTLPPDEATAVALVRASGLPDPTVWIHSGGGLYPWWLFRTPAVVTPQSITQLRTLSYGIQKILGHTFEVNGAHYGTQVGDLARVLRLPGTVNRKLPDTPRMCEFFEDPMVAGTTGTLYEVAELAQLVAGLVAQIPEPEPIYAPAPPPRPPGAGLSPGDDFEARTDWDDALLLAGAGWRFRYQRGQTRYWERPGGSSTGGISATTGHDPDRDRLYVFTDATEFVPNESYTKFSAYALLHHGGNHKAAAAALRALNYGGQFAPPPQPVDLMPHSSNGHEPPAPQSTPPPAQRTFYRFSDVGNATRMTDMFGNMFRRCTSEKTWYQWNGKTWSPDHCLEVERAATRVTETILDEADALVGVDDEAAKKLSKFGLLSQSNTKIKGMVERFAAQPGIAVTTEHFDRHMDKITVGNGILDLVTGELGAFDSSLMLTRMFGANYDPSALAPRFEQFMRDILPDEELRTYVQRALGYTLLGRANERAIFLLFGPSGTGKSQMLLLMQRLFGMFGGAAAAAALRQRSSEMTNDLHGFRGKRFITTSETSEQAKLDEELVKRLTGRDDITSRDLYQSNITWTPECAIWMATNFLPKLNSDDNALWRRVKAIKFDTVFADREGGEVPDIGLSILADEASGILNWVLAGLAAYRARGLDEPAAVTEAVREHKVESDNVAQFMRDSLETGSLVTELDAAIKTSHLWAMYDVWCKQNRVPGYGLKRFTNRMRALGYEQVKRSTMHWLGVRAGPFGVLGSMG